MEKIDSTYKKVNISLFDMLEKALSKPYLSLSLVKVSIINTLFTVVIIYVNRLFKKQIPDFSNYFSTY